MTEYEANGLRVVLRVLTKWVEGRHHSKRYTPVQRKEDIKRIEAIMQKLKAHEQEKTTDREREDINQRESGTGPGNPIDAI